MSTTYETNRNHSVSKSIHVPPGFHLGSTGCAAAVRGCQKGHGMAAQFERPGLQNAWTLKGGPGGFDDGTPVEECICQR